MIKESWLIRTLKYLNKGIPNSLLIYGKEDLGKKKMALALSKSLLCEKPHNNIKSCEKCNDCHLFEETIHPDFLLIEPVNQKEKEKLNKSISISEIRKVSNFLIETSHRGKFKIILIDQIEFLTKSAANSLLKSLEEPSKKVFFILISNDIKSVMKTIKSRCFLVRTKLPNKEDLNKFFKNKKQEKNFKVAAEISENMPYKTQRILSDCNFWKLRKEIITSLIINNNPMEIAEISQKFELKSLAIVIQTFIYDIIACKSSGSIKFNTDFSKEINSLSKKVPAIGLYKWYDEMITCKRNLKNNLNIKLAIENFFLKNPFN